MNYVTQLFNSLTRKSNRGLAVYLAINFLLIWAFFGSITATSIIDVYFPTLYSSSTYGIVVIILGLIITLVAYFISLLISLSSVGESILRTQLRAKKIKRKEQKNRLYPIYNEVYQKVVKKYPYVSKNIELFISDEQYPNACAAGQNTIIVTKGLLELSDDQIKGILAHEFAHIVNKDTDMMLIINVGNMFINMYFLMVNFAIALYNLFLSDKQTGKEHLFVTFYRFIMLIVVQKFLQLMYLLVLKSSRECEYDADRFAVDFGYGQDLIDALDIIAQEDHSKGWIEKLSSTHPNTDDRIASIEEAMDKAS